MDSSITPQRQSKNMIDVMKLVMAICVIAIHTRPFAGFSLPRIAQSAYDTLISLAVPFFFLASGYFLGAKLKFPLPRETDISIVLGYLKKTVRLYLTWTAVYFPLALGDAVINKTPPLRFILMYIRGVFLIGENYNSWILWYLLSTIYALILILLLMKLKLSLPRIAFIGCLIIPVSIGFDLLSGYSGELPSILSVFKKLLRYSIENGRILRGMYFMPLGMLLAHRKLSPSLGWLLFLSCFALDCAISDSLFSSVLLVFASVGLFSIAESIALPPSRIYANIRRMSTVFYFIHLYVWTLYYTLVYGEKTYGMDCFLFTVLGCALLSWLYLIFSRQKKGRMIKK